ncbi:MAG: dependent oxidoreductase [Chloroflexi bacterium]|nr:dependent oxidoreductase [Chloroflexota bacterium]
MRILVPGNGASDLRYDLVIVGGGIIGLGAARDAALRGLRVALVEKEDYGWGTSNRATRLAHGGLRYLEMYDFGLVREDLRERERLFRNAPHLVKPLPFLVPLYNQSLFNRLKLRAGMVLYDALSYDKSLPNHRHLNPQETLALEPGLRPEGLQGSFRYFDGQITFTERLNVENAIAAREAGATLYNHSRATGLLRQGDAVCGVIAEDTITGERRELRARLVLNAAGPWLDDIGAMTGRMGTLSRRTKGVHLVMPKVGDTAVVLYAKSDVRLFVVVPWNGYSLVGTTDTDYTGSLDRIAAEPEDIRYLLSEVRRAYPNEPWDPIYFTWAGVRSLMHIEGIPESDVSRKHLLYDHLEKDGIPGLLSIIGGKLTAYRWVAEDVVDTVCRILKHPGKSRTADLPLPGGMLSDLERYVAVHTEAQAARLNVPPELIAHLIRTYGARYSQVLDFAVEDRALFAPVSPHSPDIMAQVVHAVENEGARTVSDVVLRRLTSGMSAGRGREGAEAVAALLAQRFAWDHEQVQAELNALDEQIALGSAPPLTEPSPPVALTAG